jgi:Flp pilus assembly protein TadG
MLNRPLAGYQSAHAMTAWCHPWRMAVTGEAIPTMADIPPSRPGLLSRLRRDRAGNVMIMMAGMMFVLACFVGCAIDAARFYVVNSRLQQACDAGALAGRRAMTDTTLNGILDAVATAQAQSFFKNNFSSGWFGTTGVTFTPSKTSDGQLSASAQVTVPTVIMRILGINSVSLTATCAARLDVPDTDVIFVLDTTGSMACLPSDDDNTCNNYAGSAGKVSYLRPLDGSASGNNSMAGYPGSTAYYVPENRDRAYRRCVRRCSASTTRSPPPPARRPISATASSPIHRR